MKNNEKHEKIFFDKGFTQINLSVTLKIAAIQRNMDQAECPGEQDRIRIIADADYHIFHGHFNRMGIVKVRLVYLRCYMLFRKVIRNNINGNHVLL